MEKKEVYSILFNKIDEFAVPKEGILVNRNSSLDNLNAAISTSEHDFSVSFEWYRFSEKSKNLRVGKSYKKVGFQSKNTNWVFEDFYISNASNHVDFINQKSSHQLTASSRFIYTKGYSKTALYYYRLLVPLSEEFKTHFVIGSLREVTIENDPLKFYFIQRDKKKHFLVIESDLKQPYDIFSKKAFALKIALGYLTGHLAGDRGFYFAYTKKRMETPAQVYHSPFHPSIISIYKPIWSNPYGFIRNDKHADRYYKNKVLRTIKKEELSTLCQRLYDSDEFSSAINLMLESSVASLLFRPGGYAIVLETLADIIKPEKKVKVAPMKPALSKKVRKECLSIGEQHWQSISKQFSITIEKYEKEISADCIKALNQYKDSLTEESLETLKKRIDGINKATNKAQLKRPFDYLNIILSKSDLEILGTRDDFLHGRVPDITKAGKQRPLDRQNRDLYYASVKFYTLLNMLILKWIGYDNYVVNYAKYNETYTKVKLDEDVYKEV
ncbi:MAG: hypothetical protein CL840_02590 [Crocinitomicaceae bacterium]|nr:hypothetical protein [Crocinitomicaceae bacterium]|tara:strand:+ start:2139 stop:3635 length:1497 start_codon:yes stop_codon:yes gene_type:complete